VAIQRPVRIRMNRRAMRRVTAIIAGLVAIGSGLVTVPQANAAQPVIASACTAGTWVQQNADVTPAMVNGALYSVTIVSASEAWAVGEYSTGGYPSGSLWEHWTGGSSWQVVGSGSGAGVSLNGMTNFGPSDVWAVGTGPKGATKGALIAQWNGSSIVRASIPSEAGGSSLSAVSGTSASDIWAVGAYADAQGQPHTLLYHYNGRAWSLAASPPGGNGVSILALSPTDVWMMVATVGGRALYQWNGSTWTDVFPANSFKHPVEEPLVGTADNHLSTRTYETKPYYNYVEPYNWNGFKWTEFGPKAAYNNVYMTGLAEGPAGALWTAGFIGTDKGDFARDLLIDKNGATSLEVVSNADVFWGIATGFGVVVAVGGDLGTPGDEPVVYMSCS
jgi:hypothetical protein